MSGDRSKRMPPSGNPLDETWLVLNVYDAAMALAELGKVGLSAYPRFPSYSTFAKEWDDAMARLAEACSQAKEGR